MRSDVRRKSIKLTRAFCGKTLWIVKNFYAGNKAKGVIKLLCFAKGCIVGHVKRHFAF